VSQMTRWIGMTMLLALAAAAPVRAELKIGVVDMQRALNDCDAGKKARDQVKAKFEKAQDQLKRQREDLDRLRGDYDKKAVVLKEEERRNLEKDLENRSLEFKRKYEDFQRDLKRTDSELTAGIVDELYGLVRDYGEKHGYSFRARGVERRAPLQRQGDRHHRRQHQALQHLAAPRGSAVQQGEGVGTHHVTD